jgi:hypothetical protein
MRGDSTAPRTENHTARSARNDQEARPRALPLLPIRRWAGDPLTIPLRGAIRRRRRSDRIGAGNRRGWAAGRPRRRRWRRPRASAWRRAPDPAAGPVPVCGRDEGLQRPVSPIHHVPPILHLNCSSVHIYHCIHAYIIGDRPPGRGLLPRLGRAGPLRRVAGSDRPWRHTTVRELLRRPIDAEAQ